jgi:hypothetical protein
MAHRFVQMPMADHNQVRVVKNCSLLDHFSNASFQYLNSGCDVQFR